MKWIVLAFLAGVALEMGRRNRQGMAVISPKVRSPLVELNHQMQPMSALPLAEAITAASTLAEQAQLLLTLMQRASLNDIPEILKVISERVHGFDGDLLRRLVVTVWLERDSEHLLDHLETMGMKRDHPIPM